MSIWKRFLEWLNPSENDVRFLFRKPKRAVDRIFVHCSASDNQDHDDIEVIRSWHMSAPRYYSDVGYHYFITKAGEIQEGRTLEHQPAAQYPHNKGTIAICLHGLEESKFTQAQIRSLKSLCIAINDSYSAEVTFHGHKEVSIKTCPVLDYKDILQLDKDGKLGI